MKKIFLSMMVASISFHSLANLVLAAPQQNDLPAQVDYSHHYIIFLLGIISSSFEEGPPLGDRYKTIQDHLQGLGITNFVYFSYAAATAVDRGELMCAGWGSKGCAGGPGSDLGDLAALDLSPGYSEEDTKVDVDRQADALEWLIGQIVKRDAQAQIDLVGFSLGGVIATRWGSRAEASAYYDHVHGIVAIASPLGGIPLASAFLGGCDLVDIRCKIWETKLRKKYGDVVGAQLQYPDRDPEASIIDDVRDILKNEHFIFASIQSTDDYTVNGKLFPLCRTIACIGPTYDTVLIGYGTQYWDRNAYIHYYDESLGGLGIPTEPIYHVNMDDYLEQNHGATLSDSRTAKWVGEIVQTPSRNEPGGPADEAPPGSYDARGSGFTYDIIQQAETAHLEFQVTNSGQTTWEGRDFKFFPAASGSFEELPSLFLPRAVKPGEVITLQVDIPYVFGNPVETIEYQMSYQGKPFGETIKGTIFILPDEAKDIEKELRKKIDELVDSGEKKIDELVDAIVQEIQKAIEREAKKSLDNLLRQCLPANGLIILGAAMVYTRRKSRNDG